MLALDLSRTPLFRQRQTVRWGDMDAYRHVNNVMYFRYLEEARIAWLSGLGFPVDQDSAPNGPVLASTRCDYRKSIVYPAEIEILSFVARVGNSSFSVQQAIVDADDPAVVYAVSESTSVWIDYASGRSMPLPDALRANLESAG